MLRQRLHLGFLFAVDDKAVQRISPQGGYGHHQQLGEQGDKHAVPVVIGHDGAQVRTEPGVKGDGAHHHNGVKNGGQHRIGVCLESELAVHHIRRRVADNGR